MHILAIETTGPYCSRVINGDAEVVEITSEQTLSHLQSLTVMIGDVLQEAGTTLKDLAAIAVSEGPGSFTGVRIGVSTARGISQVLGTKLIAVPTLEAFDSTSQRYRDEKHWYAPWARRRDIRSPHRCTGRKKRKGPLHDRIIRDMLSGTTGYHSPETE